MRRCFRGSYGPVDIVLARVLAVSTCDGPAILNFTLSTISTLCGTSNRYTLWSELFGSRLFRRVSFLWTIWFEVVSTALIFVDVVTVLVCFSLVSTLFIK